MAAVFGHGEDVQLTDQCTSFRCRVNQAGHNSGIGGPLDVIMLFVTEKPTKMEHVIAITQTITRK